MSKCQKFPKEFRAESVELFLPSDNSLVGVTASMGINEGTLSCWIQNYQVDHPAAEAEEPSPVDWAKYEKLPASESERWHHVGIHRSCRWTSGHGGTGAHASKQV